MITTVTLNAAIDKTYFVDSFPLGQVTRVSNMSAYPGGKGINVARVVHLLGETTLATGFVGGHNGRFILEKLTEQQIAHDFVVVEGESRLCLNVIDEQKKSSTELLEQGPEITAEQTDALKEKVKHLAQKSAIICFSGSTPLGVKPNIYAELIHLAKREGALAFLDASGDALLAGIEAKPDFIKPNETEVTKITGKDFADKSELFDHLLQLNRDGIKNAFVSLGSLGAVVAIDEQIYEIRPPEVEVVNTVGCGDAFVAGFAFAVKRGLDLDEQLKCAAAAGTANALMVEAGKVDPYDVEKIYDRVTISAIK